ncbi:MAG TPA: nucleotidyltransferase family protein [Methylomirabilota bacterium]|nr:nucleotidyltransferase family protein [Methylomirabilota bacterium]
MIAGVVLAAGLSRRMGRPKLLLPLDGRPLIRRTVEALAAAGLAELVVVVPPESDAIRAALDGLPVRFAVNPAPEAGQAGSVVAGVAALTPATTAALIALGDQPDLPRVVLAGLLERHRAGGAAIVAPRYREGRGNPVLFTAAVFPELLRLTGDQGARAVVVADAARVALVPFDLPMPRDVDTPDDYESLRRHR